MRAYVLLVLVAAGLSACGSSSDEARERACVDRLLQQATPQDARDEAARRYARETYCAPFERKGWVYEDGALKIAAQTWLEESARCAVGSEGEPTRTVPCEEEQTRMGRRRLDCGLLRHVRKSEVRTYVERLERKSAVECDDGTPLEELGVP